MKSSVRFDWRLNSERTVDGAKIGGFDEVLVTSADTSDFSVDVFVDGSKIEKHLVRGGEIRYPLSGDTRLFEVRPVDFPVNGHARGTIEA